MGKIIIESSYKSEEIMTEFSVVSASQLDRSNYDEQLPIPLLVQLHASLTNEASAGGR